MNSPRHEESRERRQYRYGNVFLWWTGKPGVLQSTGSRRVGHNWANWYIWTGSLLPVPPGKPKFCKLTKWFIFSEYIFIKQSCSIEEEFDMTLPSILWVRRRTGVHSGEVVWLEAGTQLSRWTAQENPDSEASSPEQGQRLPLLTEWHVELLKVTQHIYVISVVNKQERIICCSPQE